MSIRVYCCVSGEELDEPGAILMSPPNSSGSGACTKFHICKKHYVEVLKNINLLRIQEFVQKGGKIIEKSI